jgi:DGQHR domain-containing protein
MLSAKVQKLEVTEALKRDPHQEEFVNEIVKLFRTAGFDSGEIAKQLPTAEGPDIIITHKAEDKSEFKIIVQCRRGIGELKEYPRFSAFIRDYRSLVQDYKADVALLILDNYDIPSKFKESEEIEEALRKKVAYWDNRALAYYKIITKTLRSPWARYLILRDLGKQIMLQQKPYEVDAIQIMQRLGTRRMWCFSMTPDKLLNLAYVFRRGSRDPDAYQRLLDPKRLTEIGKWLSKKESMLANNIIVAFDEKLIYKKSKLYIPAKTCSAWIVDGQHRLYGFCRLDEKLKTKDQKRIRSSFRLPIIGIEADPVLQARLFTEINSTQVKINRNLLLDLYDHFDIAPEKGLLDRIRVAKKLAKTDVFKGKVKIIPKLEKGTLTLATFVDYPKFKKLVTEKSEKAYSILTTFFDSVRKNFPQWDNPKDFIFSTERGVRILTSLLTRIIEYAEREGKKLDSELYDFCLSKLKEATIGEPDFFKRSNYVGEALGATAPDKASRDLWAARIDEKIENFLSDAEKKIIGRDEKRTLKELEEKLRNFIVDKLSAITPQWWTQLIPQDVRNSAIERMKRDEGPWPWFERKLSPPECYLNFSDYRKIIIKRNNWIKVFQPIFKDQTITQAKLIELEHIRDNIAHHRKLTSSEFDHLKLYARDIIKCIEESNRLSEN